MNSSWPLVLLSSVLEQDRSYIYELEDRPYPKLSVKLYGRGCVLDGFTDGKDVKMKRHQLANPGQVILSEIWGKKGAIGIVPEEGDGALVTSHFFLFDFDPTKVTTDWLLWLTKANYFENELSIKAKGSTGYAAVRPNQFLDLSIPLPSLEDQQGIVNKMEMLSEKIKQLESLQEKAIEESTILLLSLMKKFRWELLKSSYPREKIGLVTKVTSGGTPSRSNPSYWGGTIPWIKTGELLDGDIENSEEFITQDGLQNSSAKIFPVNTILIALYGQGQTRGRTGRLVIEAATNQACCAVLPVECLEPLYLQYWLSSMYTELREQAHGGAQPNWNIQMIKDLEIVIPPKNIQVRFIDQINRYNIKVKELTKFQQSAHSRISSLLPSLLDKAFQGKLT
ncbi:MAG: restriction endonuclease subunit S [Bellilinea sp.]